MDGIRKTELMKELHEQVRLHIEEKTTKYAKQANKGQKMVRFEPGDLVWIHIRKGRFPGKPKSKLMPRADGPFWIIEKVNDNAYKVDLPSDYNVSTTFKFGLFMFQKGQKTCVSYICLVTLLKSTF